MSRITTTLKVELLVISAALMLVTQFVFAQVPIRGKIKDETGAGLVGASVVEKGTTNGSTTDVDGNYSIQVNDASAVLVFSFVGYVTEEVQAGSQTSVDVTLTPDIAALQEIVVIGYGSQKSADVTGAVFSVKPKDFLVGKIQDATDMIKGKVPGLWISKGSGDPNATSSLSLRGVTTILGNVEPLVLINGVPGDIATVAPDNIESIDVLKDASAAAIYGTRGANGVILIKTKSGQRDSQLSVTYTGYASISDFYKKPKFMDASDTRRGLTSYGDEGWDTDWVRAITRTGQMHNHSLTINGGTKNSAYSGNVSYRYEEGTIKKTDNDQYRLQFNFDQYLFKDIVKINMNIFKQYHINSVNDASWDGVAAGSTNVYRQAIIRNPTAPIYDETTGKYAEDFNRLQYYNPVSMQRELSGKNETETTNLIGNITVEPISNWKTNLMLSNNLFNQNYSNYYSSQYFSSITLGFPGTANRVYNGYKKKTLELTSTYDFIRNDHRLSILGGYSYYYTMYNGFNATNGGFPTDSYTYNQIGAGSKLKSGKAGMGSYKNDATLVSFFGRLQYNYKGKLNLLASIRKEGSSKFGANNQWGLFPAVSAGWNINKESFMSSVTWLDNLKLRAGYGVTGRMPDDSYRSLTLYKYDNNDGNYLDGNGNWVPGLFVNQNPNPDLKWETTAEVNVGLDFALFSNKVKGSVDVYNRKTTDLLYDYTVPVPPNLYDITTANVGSLRNRGFEIMLGGTPIASDHFEWNTTATVSHNEATLLSLSNDLYETNDYLDQYSIGDPISVPSHRWKEGTSMGNFWGLKSVGVTPDGIWLIEDPKTGEAVKFTTDFNNDSYRQILGNGIPKVILGWNNTFRYKNFDLNIQMTSQLGYKILNQQRMFYENNSIQYNRLKSAADPVYGVTPLSSSQVQAFVSYYLENGNFAKIDNTTLGYNFGVGNSKLFSKVRVYGSAQNFLIITKYKGLDPELNFDFRTPGSDNRDKYPTIRSFSVGLNVTFK